MSVVPVAVAIATVDRPDALARCLDSLLAAPVLPAEIVVVDQGGRPETGAALDGRSREGVRLAHVVVPRRGLAASRNAAAAETTAPVLAVTDDDCVPESEWVETIASAFAAPDAPDALAGRVLPLGPAALGLHAVSSRTSELRRELSGRAVPWDVGTGANLAVRREWLERVGGYDERLGAGTPGRAGEDMDMLYRLLRAGARIRYEPDAVVRHERHPTARRRASRFGYGVGIGAFCAVWLRRRDPYALAILGRWLAMRLRLLAAAVPRRRWSAAADELRILAGTVRGLAYGLRAEAP
jgi:GT2 family glycosyltransferase